MLILVTAIPELWAKVKPHLDYANDEAKLDQISISGLPDSEAVLLELARHLFNLQVRSIDLSDVLDLLDDDNLAAVMAALEVYRKQ